ncbi:hypothetical protein SLE2022_146660 [Rubroshorea leprosula]
MLADSMRGICDSGNAPDEKFRRCIRSVNNLSRGFVGSSRITFILLAIWWGFGEVVRLSFLRKEGGVLHAHTLQWQENVCKCYIVSNLGFAEPCLFLTLVFLLRAPLQKMENGILSQNWNGKTVLRTLLSCLPIFLLQLFVILIGPQLSKVLTVYLFWLGRRIWKLVINKGLQKRVYTLIFSVSSFLPLRVLLLGLSVLPKSDDLKSEALTFLAFLALVCFAGICICMLVYLPIADCLALGSPHDLEARRRVLDEQNDTISLIANQSHLEESSGISPERNSDASTKRGSISFRAYGKDGSSTGTFVELSLFSPSRDATPPGSPPLLGWPMRYPTQVQEPQK